MTEPKDDNLPAAFGEQMEPISKHMEGVKIAPVHGIAAMALTMALKYHDINTVQDGALYQQYKLEGRNMRTLQLDHVFETAMRIELHLMSASDRITKLLIEAVVLADEAEKENPEGDTAPAPQSNG